MTASVARAKAEPGATTAAEVGAQALPVRLLMSFSEPQLEQRFLRFYEAFYCRYAQASLLLGMLLIIGDWLVDWLASPAMAANHYRVQLVLPILLAGLLVSFTRWGRAHWQLLMAATITAVAISLYWTLAQIDLQGGHGLASWVGILNFTFFEFYCFVILGIGFRHALPTGLLIFALFEVAILGSRAAAQPHALYLSYHFTTVLMLAAMIGWWREYLLRKEFLAVTALEAATQAAQTQAAFLAGHDALTGLRNLSGFSELLATEAGLADQQRRPLSLLLINLGRLRRMRDAMGQGAADALMLALTARLQLAAAGMAPAPVFARTTSFELAVLLRHASGTAALIGAAERLLDVLRQPFDLDGQAMHLQAVGGLALYPADGATLDAVLQAARMALATRAGEGRDLHFYDAERDRALAQRLQFEDDLRGALAAGQFSLAYQPVLRVADGQTLGVEALLRWTHPQRGPVGPAEFVPLLEELGLIHEVGEWALNQACRQAMLWAAAGLPLEDIAVNVSGLQLAELGFADRVAQALVASGLPPHRLVLELTESVLVHDNDAAMSQLRRLKALGLRLALDDFGTGFSSMQSITRFPFDIIKLDRSFVQTAPEQAASAAIVEAIIALAARLGMVTVGEGIETAQQRDFLGERGCGLAQGYLFARPMAADGLVSHLRACAPA